MVLGGIPLLAISILNHDNALSGGLGEFTANDILALLYTSIFGSAISYGVYFYSATKGSFHFILTFIISLKFHYFPLLSYLAHFRHRNPRSHSL